MSEPIQCKDIDPSPILRAMGDGRWYNAYDGHEKNIHDLFPRGLPYLLRMAKLKKMTKSGLLSGCACGCRGDFEVTEKGRSLIEIHETPSRSDG